MIANTWSIPLYKIDDFATTKYTTAPYDKPIIHIATVRDDWTEADYKELRQTFAGAFLVSASFTVPVELIGKQGTIAATFDNLQKFSTGAATYQAYHANDKTSSTYWLINNYKPTTEQETIWTVNGIGMFEKEFTTLSEANDCARILTKHFTPITVSEITRTTKIYSKDTKRS